MEVKKIAVIGSGIMGKGIAQVCALGGFKVKLNDINMEVLEKARVVIQGNLAKGVRLGKIKQEDMDASLGRLELDDSMERAVADVEMVIEAVPEDLELKLDIFRRLDKMCDQNSIFATNTSAKSITEIAAATSRPQQVIGLHFFNPVHLMKLVEIVKGLETNEETFAIAEVTCRQMGKETVKINEYPGFVTSRINVMIGNEAFFMLEQGVGTPADIDKALKLGLNHPMGPFELVDIVGLDTRLKVLEYLHASLGDKYRPAPLLVKYVKAGRLGRKVGKGVYEYPDER